MYQPVHREAGRETDGFPSAARTGLARTLRRLPLLALAGLVLTGRASGATTVINGSFTDDLAGWSTEGSVAHGDGFALVNDEIGTVSSIFQTFEVSGMPGGLELSFFSEGLTSDTGSGGLLDTAFLTLYLGDDPFGDSVETPNFAEAIPLFDLDSGGLRNAAEGAVVENIAGRPGWQSLYVPVPVTYQFATLAFELVDQNQLADSVTTLDEVESVDYRPDSLTYPMWLTVWFRETERAQPDLVDPGADPDGDEAPNVYEFLAGTDPRDPRSVPGEPGALLVDLGATRHLALRFERSLAPTGVLVELETSNDLRAWAVDRSAEVVTRAPTTDPGREEVILRMASPIEDAPAAYARLRISLAPAAP